MKKYSLDGSYIHYIYELILFHKIAFIAWNSFFSSPTIWKLCVSLMYCVRCDWQEKTRIRIQPLKTPGSDRNPNPLVENIIYVLFYSLLIWHIYFQFCHRQNSD